MGGRNQRGSNGNLIYYNGWDDEGTRGSGHGIYAQGVAPDAKKILDNICSRASATESTATPRADTSTTS